jgi:hypothetical protein
VNDPSLQHDHMTKLTFRSVLINLTLVLVAALCAAIVGEVLLRYALPYPSGFWQWPPGLAKTFYPDPEVLPGVQGPTRFVINSSGIRGDEFSASQHYRIMTIGGSSTECLYLDERVAWPRALQTILDRARPDLRAWVGNLGKSGFNTRHHILQMQYLLPQLPHLDAIVVLVGINDMGLRLMMGDSYDPHFLERPEGRQHLMRRTFLYYPLTLGDRLDTKNTAWWRLTAYLKTSFFSEQIQDEAARKVAAQRKRRQQAPEMVDTLPDLHPALGEYARNLNIMIDAGRDRYVRMVFVTQPSLWRDDLTDAEQHLLWAGGIGNYEEEGAHRYYTARQLMRAMNLYNEKLLEVCRAREVECIDLAAALPKNTTVFYDDCHFNENGSLKVAAVIGEYLLSKPPFGTIAATAASQ